MTRPALLLSATVLALAGHAGTASANDLARVFHMDMIGANVSALERVTGPALRSIGSARDYRVAGCDLTATIEGGMVNALRLEPNARCTFNLNALLPNYGGQFAPVNTMTFGQFDAVTQRAGRYYADCLSSCGNAADPIVFEHWFGSRADLSFEVLLEAVQVSDAALGAADRWQQAMEREQGADWVVAGEFNCTSQYDDIAHDAFRSVRITAITIGFNLRTPECMR